MRQLLVFFVLILSIVSGISCRKEETSGIGRSFYYWKTSFLLSGCEKKALTEFKVKRLYIRFFDVDWDSESAQPIPVGKINFQDCVSVPEVIPVVFITNKTFLNLPENEITLFAKNTVYEVERIASVNNLSFREVQFDCDWSETTKAKYFSFIEQVKMLLTHPVKISATIRLHQVKYKSITGVPPVDLGMLMFYNMGKLKSDAENCSIYNRKDAEKYVQYIVDYPLHLDVALPVFSWDIQIRRNKIINLISKKSMVNPQTDKRLIKEEDNIFTAGESFYENGIYFQRGDKIKREEIKKEELLEAAMLVSAHLKKESLNVVFFDLDEFNLNKFDSETLQEVFNHFE